MITRSLKKASRTITKNMGKLGSNVGGRKFGAALEGGFRNLGEPMADFAITSSLKMPFNAPRKGWDRMRESASGVWGGIRTDIDEKFVPNVGGGPGDTTTEPSMTNARSFGNTEYRSETVYGEGDLPGAINTEKYKA